MAKVVLPPTLAERLDGESSHDVDGATAGDVLRALERRRPNLAGWILDETGRLRQHVALFVDSRKVSLGRPIGPDEELYVVQAISGGNQESEIEVLVGTKKGLFVLRGARGGAYRVARRLFAGQTVDYACFDTRSGTYFASVTHGQFGPHLYFSESLAVSGRNRRAWHCRLNRTPVSRESGSSSPASKRASCGPAWHLPLSSRAPTPVARGAWSRVSGNNPVAPTGAAVWAVKRCTRSVRGRVSPGAWRWGSRRPVSG